MDIGRSGFNVRAALFGDEKSKQTLFADIFLASATRLPKETAIAAEAYEGGRD